MKLSTLLLGAVTAALTLIAEPAKANFVTTCDYGEDAKLVVVAEPCFVKVVDLQNGTLATRILWEDGAITTIFQRGETIVMDGKPASVSVENGYILYVDDTGRAVIINQPPSAR